MPDILRDVPLAYHSLVYSNNRPGRTRSGLNQNRVAIYFVDLVPVTYRLSIHIYWEARNPEPATVGGFSPCASPLTNVMEKDKASHL
jgi:hypothetical protein